MKNKNNIFNVKNKDFNDVFLNGNIQNLPNTARPIQVHDPAITTPFLKFPTPLHRPEYHYFVFGIKGEAVQRIENITFNLKPNQILYVSQGTITSILSISDDIQGYIITIEDEVFSQIINKKDRIAISSIPSVTSLSNSTSKWLQTLISLLIDELNATPSSTNKVTLLLVETIIQKILLEIQEKENLPAFSRSAEVLFEFKDLLNKNFASQKTVSFYADKLNVTTNYLNRCVKERTTFTVKEWINQVVILNSQLILQTTNKDIGEIAFELDFEDPSYFGRLFKKVTGVTPSDYRDNYKHDLSENQ